MLSVLDIVLLAVIAFSAIISIFRGFIREAFSIATWIASFWISWHYSQLLSVFLTSWISNPVLRYPVAFIGLFVVTMLLGGLLNYLLGQLVDKSGLSGTDRALGLLFGLLRGVLIIGILLMVMRLTPAPAQSWWKDSKLVPAFMPLEAWLQSFLPQEQQSNYVMRTDTP